VALFLALTGGSEIKLYYQDVYLTFVDNLTIFNKEYGPLHNLYTIYVILVFLLMFIKIIISIIKKKVKVSISPIVLVLLGTENMFVWIVQKFINIKFELLTVSYVITEMLFILLFKNDFEYKKIIEENKKKEILSVDKIIQQWADQYSLTEREFDILKLLIDNIPRADIAKSLFISEHTVKKHTANLYEKLRVTSRNDLLYKLNEEIYK